MVLPGTIWLLPFSYLPMFGQVLAYKKFRIHPDGFFASVMKRTVEISAMEPLMLMVPYVIAGTMAV
jgi:ABC-type polysaccharide transport system permease subunit